VARRLTWKGEVLNQAMNLSAFAEQMLVHEHAVVKVCDDVPLDRCALVGCGAMTDVGAVFHAAKEEHRGFQAGGRQGDGCDRHDQRVERRPGGDGEGDVRRRRALFLRGDHVKAADLQNLVRKRPRRCCNAAFR
jgi:hypothetical protein